jgi:hypothetical protein
LTFSDPEPMAREPAAEMPIVACLQGNEMA